jgi:hypothetical protein
MRSSEAETLALKVLGFLAREDTALDRFLTLSGIHPRELRARADDPLLLAAVVDFLLGDDALVTAFAQEEGLDPKMVHQARRALPGAAPEV